MFSVSRSGSQLNEYTTHLAGNGGFNRRRFTRQPIRHSPLSIFPQRGYNSINKQSCVNLLPKLKHLAVMQGAKKGLYGEDR